jgi:UDP-hydrolysing UDP-N-acetyl-D-glucosamine 2-epimerase
MAKSVGIGMVRIIDELQRLKPDLVFVNADRFEMMAVTLAAAYLNIPIAHHEGGDVSGTIDESVRHAITKFAHLHFAATETSRKRILQMGEDPRYVFTVGSPTIDAIKSLNSETLFIYRGSAVEIVA